MSRRHLQFIVTQLNSWFPPYPEDCSSLSFPLDMALPSAQCPPEFVPVITLHLQVIHQSYLPYFLNTRILRTSHSSPMASVTAQVQATHQVHYWAQSGPKLMTRGCYQKRQNWSPTSGLLFPWMLSRAFSTQENPWQAIKVKHCVMDFLSAGQSLGILADRAQETRADVTGHQVT